MRRSSCPCFDREPVASPSAVGAMVFVCGLFSHPSGSRDPASRRGGSGAGPPIPYGTRKPFVPARRSFSHRGSPASGIPDPWKLAAGQTAETGAMDAAGANQSAGWSRPLSGFRRHPSYPNIISILNGSPFMTCQTALDSLHAKAFFATIGLRWRFFLSYQP